MTADQRTARTFLAALAVTAAVAAAWVGLHGWSIGSLDSALRNSGRVAFAVLIVVFAARPLQVLLRRQWTARLLRNRRQLGVAFAGIHTAHLGMILYKVDRLPELTLAMILNVPSALVYGLMYGMLITSFEAPARAIGRRPWKALHKIGLYVLFAGFFASQIPRSLDDLAAVNAILIALAALALAARVAAFVKQRQR